LQIASRAEDYIKKYQSLASELSINIVPGTIVTSAPHLDPPVNGSKNTLVNISTFISYTGEILGSYTKTNLWHPERPHLTSSIHAAAAGRADEERGSGPPRPHDIIETPLGPIGIVVCWDIAFPEAFRELVRRGAKIIIAPTFWMATDCSEEGLAYNSEAEALVSPLSSSRWCK
jgi:predicted amidohydrolase